MVNDLGFIETAYRPVVESKIKNDVVFLDAFQEEEYRIAQADAAKMLRVLRMIRLLLVIKESTYMLMQIILIISIYHQNSWFLYLRR